VTILPYPTSVARFPRLRQSLLSDFDNCALTSAFGVAYETGWSSHPAARGTITHRTIAKALRELVVNDDGSGRLSVDVVVDGILPDVIRQAEATDGVGWDVNGELVPAPAGGKPEAEDVVCVPLREIAQARISLKAWAANVRFTVANIAGIEKRFEATVTYPDGHGGHVERVVTGQLDVLLIEGDTAIVIDWKDTFAIPPESKISEEGYFQQRVYALLTFLFYPRVQRVVLREYYVRYAAGKSVDRKGRAINPVREATVERYNLPEIEAEVSALVERFDRAHEVGRFKVAPGSHCSYCAMPSKCPIPAEVRREGRITSAAEAEEVAGSVQRAEAIADQGRKALRPWVRNHGAVHVKDAKRPRVFGELVRTRTRRPDEAKVKQALATGQRVDELYVTEDYVEIGMHSPTDEHPFARQARVEEEMLLAAEKAGDLRHRGRR
jgi:hypothetical protein